VPTRITSVLRTAAAALAGLVLSGCGGSEEPPAVAAAAAPAARTYIRPVWDLPGDIANMSSAHLYALAVDTLVFDPGTNQKRKCNAAACDGQFVSVANQRPGPGNLGPDGTIVARLENRNTGNAPEKIYGTPKRGGNTNYYMIAFRDSAREWRWAIYSATRNAAANVKPQKISEGFWQTCKHPGNHVRERGRFRTCAGFPPTTTTAADTMGAVIVVDEEPGWLSCSAGCCTATN